MDRKIFKSVLIAAGIIAFSLNAEAQDNSAPRVKMNPSAITIPVKNGSIAMSFKGKEATKADVMSYLNKWLGLSEQHSFKQQTETTDKLGFTHVSFQQYYKGISVDGAKVLVHFKKGIVNSVNGRIAPLGTMNTQSILTQGKAIEIAKSELQIAVLFKQAVPELVIAESGGAGDYILSYKLNIEGRTEQKKLAKMNVYIDARSGTVVKKINLIHDVDVPSTGHTLYSGVQNIVSDSIAPAHYRLKDNERNINTVDFSRAEFTNNGIDNLLDYRNNSPVWGLVPTLDSVTITTAGDPLLFPTAGTWLPAFVALSSEDADFPVQGPVFAPSASAPPVTFSNLGLNLLFPPYICGITSIDVNTFDNSGEAFFIVDTPDVVLGQHNWSDTIGSAGTYTINLQGNPALDVHWGMERTYDYYKNTFNRLSYDGNGGEITNMVNATFAIIGTQNNAAALGNGVMIYGLGDRRRSNAYVSLDVAGHEFTHLVTGENGNGGLIYQGESGALNESFSDIFGACIEAYAKGQDANWEIGDEIILTAPGFIRSMSNPKLADNPDTYEGTYWKNPGNLGFDQGGVHYNSGVQNKWFYLLCEGGTGTNDKNDNYNVTAIGMEKAEQIAYRNLTTYLSPNANYLNAYAGSLQAAEDLYGENSAEYIAVKDAWFAVGIGDQDTTTSVSNVVVTAENLKLYPNPATGRVTISSDLSRTVHAQIINVVGIPVMNITISKGINPVDISTLAKGVYLIKYDTGDKGYVQKLSVL